MQSLISYSDLILQNSKQLVGLLKVQFKKGFLLRFWVALTLEVAFLVFLFGST